MRAWSSCSVAPARLVTAQNGIGDQEEPEASEAGRSARALLGSTAEQICYRGKCFTRPAAR